MESVKRWFSCVRWPIGRATVLGSMAPVGNFTRPVLVLRCQEFALIKSGISSALQDISIGAAALFKPEIYLVPREVG